MNDRSFGCSVVEGLVVAAAYTGLICAGIWLTK